MSETVKSREDEGEKLLAECHDSIIFLEENFDTDSYAGDRDILGALKQLRWVMRKCHKLGLNVDDYLRRISHDMIKRGVSQILCQILMKSLPRDWFEPDGDIDDDVYQPLRTTTIILLNYSEASEELGANICQVDGFINSLVDSLKYYREVTEKDRILELEEDMETRVLTLIKNCANMESAKGYLRRPDLLGILLKYMFRSEHRDDILRAILALSGLMTEEESELLQADVKGLKYLLTDLTRAIKDDKFCSQGWSARELAVGVKRLANYDAHKTVLVDLGVLEILREMSQVSGDDEQHAALNTILALSFADTNKDKIITEPGLVKRIRQLQLESTHENTKKAAKYILWNIREDLKRYKDHEDIGVELCGLEKHIVSNTDGAHVMISYNWTHQPLLLKVRDKVQQRGYKTWMDVDDMEGSTLESMAKAVKNADAILVCLSPQYKNSQFCRLEFDYAIKCRKPIIPLMMEQGYKPDGWLGRGIGNAFYYNISENSFDMQIESICKALGNTGLVAGTSHDVSDGAAKEAIVCMFEDDK